MKTLLSDVNANKITIKTRDLRRGGGGGAGVDLSPTGPISIRLY